MDDLDDPRGQLEEDASRERLVAARRLLDASPLTEHVLLAIEEIVFGMIGGRELAVFDVNHAAQALQLVHVRGIGARSLRLSDALDLLAEVVAGGVPFVAGPQAPEPPGGLTAAIPLKVDGVVMGLVAIFRLVAHKSRLGPQDLELLDVVGAQAAVPLHAKSYRSQCPTVRPPRMPPPDGEGPAPDSGQIASGTE